MSEIFKDIDANYIFYGHEHTYSHFKDLNKEYICVGSIGMKYPGRYSLVEIDEKGMVNITSKVIEFDVNKFQKDILTKDYPRASKYAKFLA